MDINQALLNAFILLSLILYLILLLKNHSWGAVKKLQLTKWKRKLYFRLNMLHMIFGRTGVVAGRKESLYQKMNDLLESNIAFSKKPMVLKVSGKTLAVAVTDYDTIHTIFKSDAFNGRGPEIVLKHYSGGNPEGIILNTGRDWEEVKRYTMKKFSQLGLGKKDAMISILSDSLPELLDRIEYQRKQTGNKIQVRDLFSVSVLNVILIVLGGKKFGHDDPEFIGICKGVVDIANVHLFKVYCLTFLSNMWGVREIFGYSRYMNIVENLTTLIRNFINTRESLEIYKENPEVFIDFFLQEIEKQKNNNDLKNIYTSSQLVTLVKDLVAAGMDTTSKFLENFIMYMCLYPEVQAKLQKEIDSVMGTSASPLYYECKSRMPYTLATINEVLRMTNVVPLVSRFTTKNVKIGSLCINKGTLVVACPFAVRFDNAYWKDAHYFCPERFLDDDGNLIQEKVDRMFYFGTGGRVCPGDNIAPAVAFTFSVGLLQKYSVQKADDKEMLGLKDNFGVLNGPDSFHISIFER